MYRIEVAAGEETVFRTIDELATGIRNGLITPRSRIFHAASQKWLPVEFHPHYKKALELVTGGAPMIDTGLTRPAPSTRRSPEPPRAAAPTIPPAPAPAPVLRPAPARGAAPEPPRLDVPAASHGPMPLPRAETRAVATLELEPSGDVVLPKISYPEVPTEPAEALPVARRRRSGSGPLALGGIIAVALIGGYLATRSAASPAPAEAVAAPAPGDSPAEPAVSPPPAASQPDSTPAPAPAPQRATARAPESAPRPAGPVSQAWSSSAGAIAPLPVVRGRPAPASEPPAITPAPAAPELSLTLIPLGDSLIRTPGIQRDSAAIKRILRAVTGAPTGGKTDR